MVQRCLFLDPGVLLNLCAADEGADVLAALPYRALTTPSVSKRVYTSEHDGEPTSYSAAPLAAQGVLGVVDLHGQDGSERFIELACLGLRGALGELAALASASAGMLATDDQAALGLMASLLPEVPLLTTGALIHEYAALANLPRSRVVQILTAIRERAVFLPSERDPYRDWWLSHVDNL